MTWDDCVVLRELKSLQCLSTHENVVSLKEVIRGKDSHLQFVFEFMPDGSLFDLIKRCASNKLSEQILKYNNNVACSLDKIPLEHLPTFSMMTIPRIQNILKQLLNGLDYMHSHGFVHRDIKPENILVDGDRVKLADFGLARNIGNNNSISSCSSLNDNTVNKLTDYVSTRWYRAPEVLLRSPNYGSAIDMFAIGCVSSELATYQPLFPGTTELDQIHQVFSILGNIPDLPINYGNGQSFSVEHDNNSFLLSPQKQFLLSSHANMNIQSIIRSRLRELVPVDMPFFIPMLESLLKLGPNDRITASAALKHPFFLNTVTLNHKAGTFSESTSLEIRKHPYTLATKEEHHYAKPPKTNRQLFENLPSIISKVNLNPHRLSTEFTDDFETVTKHHNTDMLISPACHLSKNSTPSLKSVRSDSSFGSSDIVSCLDDIRKELFSSDSCGEINNDCQGYHNSKRKLFAGSNDADRFAFDHGIHLSFNNNNFQLTKRPRRHDSKSHDMGGFGRSKFR